MAYKETKEKERRDLCMNSGGSRVRPPRPFFTGNPSYSTSLNGVKAIFSSRRRNSASQSRSDASVLFTGTIQDIGKL
jgi:hypothetical protein